METDNIKIEVPSILNPGFIEQPEYDPTKVDTTSIQEMNNQGVITEGGFGSYNEPADLSYFQIGKSMSDYSDIDWDSDSDSFGDEEKEETKNEKDASDEDYYNFVKGQLAPFVYDDGEIAKDTDNWRYESDFGFELNEAYEALEAAKENAGTSKNKSYWEEQVKEAQEHLDELLEQEKIYKDFIEKYESQFENKTPVEEVINPYEQAYNDAEKEYNRLKDEAYKSWGDVSKWQIEHGSDDVKDYEQILEDKDATIDKEVAGETYSIPKENDQYVEKQITQFIDYIKGEKGDYSGRYSIEVDPTDATNEADGTHTPLSNYQVQVYKGNRVLGSGSEDQIIVISPKGEFVLYGTFVPPTGWSNGTYNLYSVSGTDAKDIKNQATSDNLIASSPAGGITSTFTRDMMKGIKQTVENDYVNNRNERVEKIVTKEPKYPEELVKLAEKAANVTKQSEDYEEKMNEALRAWNDAKHQEAQAKKDNAVKDYKEGKISAVEAANEIEKARKDDSMLDFMYSEADDIVNKAADTKSDIGSKIHFEIKRLVEIKDKVESIDTTNVTKENVGLIKNDLKQVTQDLVDKSQSEIQDLVESLTSKGISLEKIRESEDFTELSTEIFAIAQNIKDKCNDIRKQAEGMGYSKTADIKGGNKITQIPSKIKHAAINALEKLDNKINPNENWKITDKLTSDELYSISAFMHDLDGVEAASEALMKSAAFNGASNVTGGDYSEAWKKSSMRALTVKDVLATAANGCLGILVSAIGVAVMPVNPVAGIALIASGSNTVGTSAGKLGIQAWAKNVSKEEQMFGTDDKKKNAALTFYNYAIEKANRGDPKAVSTYVNTASAGLQLANSLVNIASNPVTAIAEIKNGIDSFNSATQGGLKGNIDTMYTNIYWALRHFDQFNNTKFAEEYARNPRGTIIEYEKESPIVASATYGTSDSTLKGDSTYSGYREQAKDSNLATDYNAGMEQEVNEVVSDKYCKIFKTMLDKEPEYIRKVLIAIPKWHAEKEW